MIEKILFIADLSPIIKDFAGVLEKEYHVQLVQFDWKDVEKYLKISDTELLLVFLKNPDMQQKNCLHKLLHDEKYGKLPIIIFGAQNETAGYIDFWKGNIKSVVFTPVTTAEMLIAVKKVCTKLEGEYIKKMTGKTPEENLSEETKASVTSEQSGEYSETITEDKPEKQPAENQPVEQLPAEQDNRKHILVVDDDPIMLRTIMNWLKETYRVSVVKSGTAAISFLAKQKPDLILLDYEMPICSGVQTLEMIRSEKETKSIPVFFLTAVSDMERVKSAIELHPEGYLLKTDASITLLSKLDQFFGGDK